jgi:hypothetical protein
MENPGLRTLISFLHQVKKQAPVNFSGLARGRRWGYGMVNKSQRYRIGKELIFIVSGFRTWADTPLRPTPERERLPVPRYLH